MTAPSALYPDTGLEVIDVRDDPDFALRPSHPRDAVQQLETMQRLAHAFVEQPQTILQELVNAAITICGADSAGISIEDPGAPDDSFYKWVATAGQYSDFLGAVLPRQPSACGVCLQRGSPQLFRVSQPFFDLLGVNAPLVTDGLLLPWCGEETRGTIFIMAHDRQNAFDQNDCRFMTVLAEFAAMGYRQQRQLALLQQQSNAAAAASMANQLAHRINNPLQSLTNLLYLAAEGHHGEQARLVGQQALQELESLSSLVAQLLTPTPAESSSTL